MLKMLVLKILMLKKQCIAMIYYECKLSLFSTGDTKQAKKPYFHCGPLSRTSSKSTKKQKKLKDMLLEPSFVME